MKLSLDFPMPERVDDYVDLARRWLEVIPGDLAAERIERICATPLPTTSLSRHLGAFGEPGSVWGQLIWEPAERRGGGLYAYSPAVFGRYLARLSERPQRFEIYLGSLNEDGAPARNSDGFEFQVMTEDFVTGPNGEELLSLAATQFGAESQEDDVPDRWAVALRELLEGFGPAPLFGALSTDGEDLWGGTTFEENMPIVNKSPLQKGQLRGYSWITVLSPAHLERLGGPAGIERTGAFVDVAVVPTGAAILRATMRASEYDDDAMVRVWSALRSLLPAGTPMPDPFEPMPRLVIADASQDEG